MLTDQEKYRYSRQLVLSNVKESGQLRLKNASVLVIGAGGLGCPVLLYLAGSGIGRIGILDHDTVDESNLHRQILYSNADIGKPKAVVAGQKLQDQNPYVSMDVYPFKLTSSNARELFQKYDLVVDGTDNFSTRYIINDAAVLENKAVVYGALYKFEGQVTVFNYQNGPTYRCLFPDPPREALNCNEAGVLGVLPGIIGLHMANEVLKIILGTGTILSGKIQLFNGLTNETASLNIQKNVDLKINAMQTDYEFARKSLCSYDDLELREISLDDFDDLLTIGATILDVREQWEYPRLTSSGLLHIPLDQIEQRIDEIPTDRQVVVFCQSGGRSKIAIHLLTKRFGFRNLFNLKGGIKNFPSQL